MKFAKLYFLVLTLVIFFIGYKMVADAGQNSLVLSVKSHTSAFSSSSSFEKFQGFLDFSVDLEEDETSDILKKSSVYTVLFLFFTSFFMFSSYEVKLKTAKKLQAFRQHGSLSLLEIFRV